MTAWSYFCFKLRKKPLKACSALQQPVDIEEALAENPDIETIGERHLVRKSDKNLPEQSGSFRDVGLFTQFAPLYPPPNNIVPKLLLFFHPFVELALAVGIIEEYLLVEVKITGIGQLPGHLLPLDVAQTHDFGHRALHAFDVFVDEIAQGSVRRGEFVPGVLEMEEVAVGHGDEQVEFRGIVVEDPGFGQSDALGDHLQADALVVHRHEELQCILQNLFPIGFHGLSILISQRYNHYSKKQPCSSAESHLTLQYPMSKTVCLSLLPDNVGNEWLSSFKH